MTFNFAIIKTGQHGRRPIEIKKNTQKLKLIWMLY